MNTDKLVELFREEVEKLEKEAYERGKRDAFEKSQVQPLSANQQRKELIEQAREFVESKLDSYGEVCVAYRHGSGNICLIPEFFIKGNRVTCVLRGSRTKRVRFVGRANCMPDEVFNADIGKAIALARALEFDVPKGFLNAAQPDEVVVGMVVETYDFYGTHHATNSVDKVEVNRGRTCLSNEGKSLTGDSLYTSFDKKLGDKIINDTNAKY